VGAFVRRTLRNWNAPKIIATAEAAMCVSRPSGVKNPFAFTSGGRKAKLVATWKSA
jgi:hypothetical protein